MVLGVPTSVSNKSMPVKSVLNQFSVKYKTLVLTSGLTFVNPLVDVNKIDIKTQNYTMSGVHNEGDVAGDDAIRVLTADGLEVVIDLTVLYRVMATWKPRC
jgi:regulator of protease activity HflC (stomatin/prohibitin superfamily)